MYLYVWRSHDTVSGASWGYRVRKGGKVLLKTGFMTALEAAKAVAALLGISIKELRCRKDRKPEKDKVRSLVTVMLKIYKASSHNPHWPADFQDLLRRVGRGKQTAFHMTCLRSVIVLAKYGPFRDALSEAIGKYKTVLKHSIQGIRDADGFSRLATVVYPVLTRAVLQVSGKHTCALATWTKCVGKGVHHHHGFVPLLVNLGVVARTLSGPLQLGAECVKVVPWSELVALRLQKALHMYYVMESKVSEAVAKAKHARFRRPLNPDRPLVVHK